MLSPLLITVADATLNIIYCDIFDSMRSPLSLSFLGNISFEWPFTLFFFKFNRFFIPIIIGSMLNNTV